MKMFQHSILINRRPEEVFDFFLDFAQAPRWRSFVRSMHLITPEPIGVGSKIHVEMDLMGSDYTCDMEVLACERPSLWRHRTMEDDFTGFIEYRFEAEGSGTRVTFSGSARPTSLYGWLSLPLIWLRPRGRTYAEQLPQLQSAMEQP